jgi:hypothetical protein
MATEMLGLNVVASVTERDIDFLVLEELQVSHEFRDWFSARVFERPVLKSHVGVWHSVVDPELGESDLIFVFDAEDGSTKAILVENKIAASAQQDQGKRYLDRGEKGQANGMWQEFQTCVIAPRRYLESPTHTEVYHCQLAYEEIMAWFVSSRSVDERRRYRAAIMLEAVNQHRRGYVPKVNDVMTAFALEYWRFAQSRYPALGMREPKPRAAGNNWMNFFPVGLPKTIDVVHQVAAGSIKVFFKHQAGSFDLIQARYWDLNSLFADLEIDTAGKSVSISVPVATIKPLEVSFDTCRSTVDDALGLASRLVQELMRRGFSEFGSSTSSVVDNAV